MSALSMEVERVERLLLVRPEPETPPPPLLFAIGDESVFPLSAARRCRNSSNLDFAADDDESTEEDFGGVRLDDRVVAGVAAVASADADRSDLGGVVAV